MSSRISRTATRAGRLGCTLVTSAAAIAWSAAAHSQAADANGWHLGLDAGARYTDNVSRTSVDEQSETLGIASLLFGVTSDRPKLDADVTGHLEYREYLDNTYDSELVGGVNGLLAYAFVPERFIWVVTDNFAQIANDVTEVDTPDNRENVNYLSTGPDLTIGLTGRTSVQLSARYNNTSYETRDTDTQGYSGSLALVRQMSEISSFSLNGTVNQVDYDEEVFVDYRIDQAFLRWSSVSEQTTFVLDGGYDRIHHDTQEGLTDNEQDGWMGRLEVSRAVASRSRIGLTAGSGLETPGQGLRRDQELTGVDPGVDEDAIVAGDAYRADYAFITWTTTWERGGLSAEIDGRSEDHDIAEEANRDVYGASIDLSRQITRRFSADLTGRYSKNDLTALDFQFDEWSVGLGLHFDLSDRFSMVARVAHIEGSSDDGTRDFEENTAYLGFSYTRAR